MQQNLRTSQGACRQAVKNRKQEANLAGTWFRGAAPKLRTAFASRTQVLIQGFLSDLPSALEQFHHLRLMFFVACSRL